MPALFLADVDARRITVCVADSDRRFPSAPKSDKCRKLHNTLRQSTIGVLHYIELPCHEAENMIPLGSLLELPLPQEQIATVTLLQEIEKKENAAGTPLNDRLKLFFDFKNGVSPEKMATLRGTNQKKYLQEKFQLIGIDISTDAVGGLGDHLTKRLTQNGKAMSDFCNRIFRCPYWKDIFSVSLSILLYFLVGTHKRTAM